MLASWLDQVLTVYGDRVLLFDLPSARRWGHLSAALGYHGADLQIAATALEHGVPAKFSCKNCSRALSAAILASTYLAS